MTVMNGIDPAIPDEDMVGMSQAQVVLYRRSGTPTQFEISVWRACDDLFCTASEARVAIKKYRHEWIEAGRSSP